jgi:ABC-type dipeptide/oligopeptide/nickel transport system permease component
MAAILPTKELLDMIEKRIPYGRFLTTVALLLAVLAVIVGSCIYLYHAAVLPTVGLVAALVTTGKISPSAFGKFLFSLAVTAVFYYALQWMHRGSSRLMREIMDYSETVLKSNGEILTLAKQTNEQMTPVLNALEDLNARVSALENRHQ